MYYEESIINNVRHYRLSPNHSWKPLSPESMSDRIETLEAKVKELMNQIDSLEASAQEHTCGG